VVNAAGGAATTTRTTAATTPTTTTTTTTTAAQLSVARSAWLDTPVHRCERDSQMPPPPTTILFSFKHMY